MKTIGIAAFGVLLLAACATTETAESAAAPADAETSGLQLTDEQAAALRRSQSYKTVHTDVEGDEIICKTRSATGSRVRKNKICGTKEEWALIDDENDRFMKEQTARRSASNSQ